MGVNMQTLQLVMMRCQGIKKGLLVEALREVKILAVACYCIKIGEHLAHSTVFHLEDALHLLLAQGIGPTPHPSCHLLQRFQCLLVAGKLVHVKMPCHDLVDGVERCPDVDSVAQAVEELYRKGAQIAVLESYLAFCKFRNHDV